jgi:hypothetical protein
MTLAIMSTIYAAIVRVADDFDFDQHFTTEYSFKDTVTGGWAPAPGTTATQIGSSSAAEAPDAAALRRRAERASLPWYRRSRVFDLLVGPLLLPEPMKLF